MIKQLIGLFAFYINYPLYKIYKTIWRFKKKIRGKKIKITNLPEVKWKSISDSKRVKICEWKKVDGNVRLTELAVIAGIARNVEENTILFEIGTFDGRTTLNLALNSPHNCKVLTLDLPKEMESVNKLVPGEEKFVNKKSSGFRFKKYFKEKAHFVNKIKQLYGDSADFDFEPYFNRCSMVFVDGSHSYNNVISDSKNAVNMVKPGGVVIWHDYGVWDEVTKALEEFSDIHSLNLTHIETSSLVFWKKTIT